MAEDYNKIDIENDSVVVITAKLAALTKALKARAEKALEGKEKSYLNTLLSKPLIELSKESDGDVIEPVEPIPEEEILGNPGSVLSKPLAEWP
jgi:hypothetical protein